MNIGAKHSLCLISIVSNTHPSESRPMKNLARGSKSRSGWAGAVGVIRGSGHVAARGGDAAVAGPVGVGELAARLIHALVSVRAEVVALRLEQIGRQPRATV